MQRGKTRTLAPMSEQFEDVSRWPVARYLRAVVAAQPDGRVLLFAGKVNWCIGFLIACSLIFMPISHLAWVHVVVFLGMPLIGFLWFIRNMPSPQLTVYEHMWRKPWQRKIDALFQLIPAFLPWVVLAKSYVR
jgi:hypothetical protein